jgi:hypothetical protein
MPVYELIGYGTETRDDIRHREYTTSAAKADLFEKIPRIDFTDSGHGIVFVARPHYGKRKPTHSLEYASDWMHALKITETWQGRKAAHAIKEKQMLDTRRVVRGEVRKVLDRMQEIHDKNADGGDFDRGYQTAITTLKQELYL